MVVSGDGAPLFDGSCVVSTVDGTGGGGAGSVADASTTCAAAAASGPVMLPGDEALGVTEESSALIGGAGSCARAGDDGGVGSCTASAADAGVLGSVTCTTPVVGAAVLLSVTCTTPVDEAADLLSVTCVTPGAGAAGLEGEPPPTASVAGKAAGMFTGSSTDGDSRWA